MFVRLLLVLAVIPMSLAMGEKTPPPTVEGELRVNEGFPLRTVLTVNDNVSVDAVLLSPKIVQSLFGKEVSKTYAVIHLTVSNRSPDAALIVHSIFIDFSQWLLAGGGTDVGCSTVKAGKDDRVDGKAGWRAYSEKFHVSCVESRIVRGQMLQAQPWTIRNVTIRALRLLGSLAAAYQFKIHDQDWIKGIAAFNGNLIPGVEAFWPDSTVDRISRLADLGFHTNTVVPKETSAILLAFFPMDRFISPGMKKIFLKSPAVFFSPMSFLVDKELKKSLGLLFSEDKGFKEKLEHLQKNCLLFAADETKLGPDDKLLKIFLDRLSLDSISIVVGGAMTLDAGEVPASISGVIADGGNDVTSNWAEAGNKAATLYGRCFSGGKPLVLEAEKFGISGLDIEAGSLTDRSMRIKYHLSRRIDPLQVIRVQVVKERKDKPAIESMEYHWQADYTLTPLGISKRPTHEGGTIILEGAGFLNSDNHPLKVELLKIGPEAKTGSCVVETRRVTKKGNDTMAIDTRNLEGFGAGTWKVRVSRGVESTDSEPFEVK